MTPTATMQIEASRLRPGDRVVDGTGFTPIARVHNSADGHVVVTLSDGRELGFSPSQLATVAWIP